MVLCAILKSSLSHRLKSSLRVPDDLAMQSEELEDLIDAESGMLRTDPAQLDNLHGCAILSTTNKVVHEVDEKVMQMLNSASTSYFSADSVPGIDEGNRWPMWFVNGLNISDLSPRELELKIGAPVVLLRNMDR